METGGGAPEVVLPLTGLRSHLPCRGPQVFRGEGAVSPTPGPLFALLFPGVSRLVLFMSNLGEFLMADEERGTLPPRTTAWIQLGRFQRLCETPFGSELEAGVASGVTLGGQI